MWCCNPGVQGGRWSCYRAPLGEFPKLGGLVCVHMRAAMCPAQHSLWIDSPEGCFVPLILGLGALAEDGAESPRAQHGFSKACGNPGCIHTNPEQSDIAARSCSLPCSCGLTVLCLCQEPGSSCSCT